MRLNPNELFPRLSITAKLAIAFVVLAVGPLVLVSALGTLATVREMRARERELLEHDLETVGQRTAHALGDLAQHVRYGSELGLADRAVGRAPPEPERLESVVASYLANGSSALFRLKALSSTGDVTVSVRRPGSRVLPEDEASQPYYVWLASELNPGETRLIPVELRSGTGGELIPAVGVVRAVRDAEGALAGAIVGEAAASEIFRGIDQASPGASGITGVVDREGRFLYHSVRKRDWATLLARRGEEGLATDVPSSVAEAVLSGRSGTLRTEGGLVVTYRPVRAPGLSVSPFFLYRTFPQASLGASVRRYLTTAGLVAVFVVLSVLGVAVVAARQLTRPLHRLQEAARRVASGDVHRPLKIATNDEIQDLAEDFEEMAAEVQRHRERLESAVEERTRELRRAEAELSRVVSLSADAIIGLDADGQVRLWNRGARTLFGYRADEAVGRGLDELILPDGPRNRQEEAYLRRRVEESGAVVAYQTVRRTKSGETIPVGLTQTLLTDDDGAVTGSSMIIRDNRAHEEVQEQMRRSERLAAVSLMAAGLAHELNNPVAILDNRIELMQRELRGDLDQERLREDLDVLRQHVRRLGSITGDLLRFARDETDEVGPLQVNDVVSRVVRLLDGTLAAEGVGLQKRLGRGLPDVSASSSAVETTLVNLLLNAQQASPPEGVVTVETRSDGAAGRVEVEVRDTGPGVPDELRNRIFEPFFTTKAEVGGTGLGLAVCRTLMERQGGTIHLARSNGSGAAFVMSFPVASGQNP